MEYLTIEEGELVREAYAYDHPEFWWFYDNYRMYVYSEYGQCSDFKYEPVFSRSEIESLDREIDRSIPDLDITFANSDLKKILLIHDWICGNVVYTERDDSNPKDHRGDIYGVFVEGKAVCEGYTMAFTYLCHKYGLDCVGVTGRTAITSGASDHAWNLVKANGNWYFIDVTWDDQSRGVDRDYFLVGSSTNTRYGTFSTQDHIADTIYGISPSESEYRINKVNIPSTKYLTYNGTYQTVYDSLSGASLSGNTAKTPGTYSAIATLHSDHIWSDWSISPKTIVWTISMAVLTAKYEGETIEKDGTPALAVIVTGFLNGDDESTAAGYMAPTVTIDDLQPGSYRLYPSGGAADNYVFNYVAGMLVVKDQPHSNPFSSTQFSFIFIVIIVAIIVVATALVLVLRHSKPARTARSCPYCGRRLSKDDEFCPQCGQMFRR